MVKKVATKEKLSTKKGGGMKKRLVLLDAHAIIHRAYHALPQFTSAKGEPTGALYGLSAMLLKIINDLKPDYLAACYDLPGPTYRHEAYEGYKAKRVELEGDLVAQINRSRDIFKAFNIQIYEAPGFEADDMLGTIVEKLKKDKNTDIIIASGDMDTLQLVDDRKVRVYTLRRGINDTILYDEKAVKERFGFKPRSLPDYKGLRGDPSDNIIGIKGIGEKTASTLIKEFGTIEEMYKALKYGPKHFEKVGCSPRIIEILKEGEEEALFSKMLAEIRRDAPIIFALPKKTWRESLDVGAILALFSDLSFRTLAVRVRALFGETLARAEKKEALEEAVDPRELKGAGIALWLLHSDTTNPSLEDILHFTKKHSFKASEEALLLAIKKEGLERVYREIELPLMPIIEKMQARGVKIDTGYLRELSEKYHRELAKLEKKIYEQAGATFNINSPRQLGEVLFDKLALASKNQKLTSTGQKSTRESELEKLRNLHPVIGDILQYRELQKLLSTYIDNIPLMVDERGRLHAHFEQCGTTTGRMSSSSPNLQNIPIRTDLGRAIRNAFVADEGFSIATLDYSQIELRLAAIMSGDSKLIGIFRSGGDVHAAVAAEVFNVPPEQVDREMRRRAKVINFGILYGMGVNALKANLGTSRAEAQVYYNEYFKNFSGLAEYLEKIKSAVARRGYTETLFGRRRYFEGIRSSIPYVRASAERMAINAPLQGTSADIIKLAMIRIDEHLQKEKLENDCRLLLQVHDELVYEVRTALLQKLVPEIKKIMESILPLSETAGVPFAATASAGKNWGEAERLVISE